MLFGVSYLAACGLAKQIPFLELITLDCHTILEQITFKYQIVAGKIVFLTQQLNSSNILTMSAITILKLSLKSPKRYQLSFLVNEWINWMTWVIKPRVETDKVPMDDGTNSRFGKLIKCRVKHHTCYLSTVQWKHPIGTGTGFYCICTIPVDLVINCLLNMMHNI